VSAGSGLPRDPTGRTRRGERTDVGRLHRDCPHELDDRLARRVGRAEFTVAGANRRPCACSDRGWPKDITTKASGSSMRMTTRFFGRLATVKVPTIPRAASHVRQDK
jgi:hypothetical protein